MGTRTFLVDFRKLQARGEHGQLVVAMMLAANDIMQANIAMRPYCDDQTATRRSCATFSVSNAVTCARR